MRKSLLWAWCLAAGTWIKKQFREAARWMRAGGEGQWQLERLEPRLLLNADPVLHALANDQVDEGQTYSLFVGFDDFDFYYGHSATVNWGDGTTETLYLIEPYYYYGTWYSGQLEGHHTYADDGSYTVTVTVSDAQTSDDGSFIMTVNDVGGGVNSSTPTIQPISNVQIQEGQTVNLAALFDDFDISDAHTATVNWGDGFSESLTVDEPDYSYGSWYSGQLLGSHTYADDGSFTVQVTVFDEANASGTASFVVAAGDVPPTLTLSGDGRVEPSTPYSLNLEVADPGDDPILEWQVTWGDGSTQTVTGSPAAVEHTFAVAGSYIISATATSLDGTFDSNGLTVIVGPNTAPTVDPGFLSTTETYVGDVVYIMGYFSDPDAGDSHQVTIDWGDGSTSTVNASLYDVDYYTFDADHAYTQEGAYTVTVTVTDNADDIGTATETLTITPAIPTLDVTGNPSVSEDRTYWLRMAASGPGADTISSWSIDWGDGNTDVVDGYATYATHVYQDVGSYTVSTTATNPQGSYAATDVNVQVNAFSNTAPVITPGFVWEPQAAVGDYVPIEVYFDDPDHPEQHTVTVDWGDGNSQQVTPESYSGEEDYTGEFYFYQLHQYAVSGTYSIAVTVTDGSGATVTHSESVEILNSGPAFTESFANRASTEGELAELDIRFTDSDPNDSHTVTVNWGDGSPASQLFSATGSRSRLVEAEHQFIQDGVYPVTITVTDSAGETVTASYTHTVTNAPPVLRLYGDSSVEADATYFLTLSASDPGDDTITSWQVDWGDGVVETLPGDTETVSHQYAVSGNVTIRASATDDDGTYDAAPKNVTVGVDPTVLYSPVLLPLQNASATVDTEVRAFVKFSDANYTDTHLVEVDWGDGVVSQAIVYPLDDGESAAESYHTYVSVGTYTVTVTVTDNSGLSDSETFTQVIAAPPPAVSVEGPAEVDEGSAFDLTLIDGGVAGLTWTIDWGDGSLPETFSGVPSATHTYIDDALRYLVRATAGDGTQTFQFEHAVAVRNVAPTVRITGAGTSTVNTAFTLGLSATDPGDDTVRQWRIDWGDGLTTVLTGNPPTAGHTYQTPGVYQIEASVNDEDGSHISNTLFVEVGVESELLIYGKANVQEGGLYTLYLHPGSTAVTSWSVRWGDGSEPQIVDGIAASVTHMYADGTASHQITATATDGTATFDVGPVAVTVTDIAPTITVEGNGTSGTGLSYEVTVGADDPGIDAVAQWLVDWGDGSPQETFDGSASVLAHTYSAAGTFNVVVTAVDEDGSHSAAPHSVEVEPYVEIFGAGTTAEGASYVLTLDANGLIVDEWFINWGDGNSEAVPAGTTQIEHVFRDGDRDVMVMATAVLPQQVVRQELAVSVTDVAPSLQLVGPSTLRLGTSTTFSVEIDDVGEDHVVSWTIDWGDGLTTTGEPGRSVLHSYAAAGTYLATVTAQDEDGVHISSPVTLVVNDARAALEVEDINGWRGLDDGGVISVSDGDSANITTRLFRLTNQGTTLLTLDPLIQLPAGATLTAAPALTALDPGQSTTFEISFDSTVMEQGPVVLNTNDPDHLELAFAVVAEMPADESILVSEGGTLISDGGAFDFGNTPLNVPITRTFTLTNVSSTTVSLGDEVSLPTGVSLGTGLSSTTLAPGEAATFSVVVDATAAGRLSGVISITPFTTAAADSVESIAFNVKARVATAEPRWSLDSVPIVSGQIIDFGELSYQQTATRTFTLANVGTADLSIEAADLILPHGYSLTSTLDPTTLQPGQSISISVTLDGDRGGSFSGVMRLISLQNSEQDAGVHLTGSINAPDLAISSGATALSPVLPTLDFGHAAVGVAQYRTLTITNSGSDTLVLTSPTQLPDHVTITSPLSQTTLTPGASASIELQVLSGSAGIVRSEILIGTNIVGREQLRVRMSAQVGQPELEVTIGDAQMIVDDASAQFAVAGAWTPQSTGHDGSSYMTSGGAGNSATWTFSNLIPRQYRIEATWPQSVDLAKDALFRISAGGKTYSVRVDQSLAPEHYRADDEPWHVLLHRVTHLKIAEPITVELLGSDGQSLVADAVRLIPVKHDSLDFGDVAVAQSLDHTVTITNTGGGDLVLTNLQLPAGFTEVSAFAGATLLPGQQTQLLLRFSPAQSGVFTGKLTLSSNDPDQPTLAVTLLGQAGQPQLNVSSGGEAVLQGETVDLGATLVGTPRSSTLTLTNAGSADLVINGFVAPAGTTVSGSSTPVTLVAGASTTIVVQLDTSSPGHITGELQIQTGSGDTAVSLAGDVLSSATLSLLADTGVAGDLVTHDPTLVVATGESNGQALRVEFDENADGVADRYTFAASDGRATHAMRHLAAGTHTIAARVIVLNPDGEIASSWQTITFQLLSQGASAPVLADWGLSEDNGEFPSDGVTRNPAIEGRIDNDGRLGGITLEIDVNGDGRADQWTTVAADGAFTVTPAKLPYGAVSVALRPVEHDGPFAARNEGAWTTFSFTFEAEPAPAILTLALANDTAVGGDASTLDPTIEGQLAGAADEIAGRRIEIDWTGDGLADAIVDSDAQGKFRYRPRGVAAGAYQVAARVSEESIGAWVTTNFTLEATPSPVVTRLQLYYPDASDPLLTQVPTVVGYIVSTDTFVDNIVVEFDHNSDGQIDGTATTNSAGAFIYTPEALAAGTHTIAARVPGQAISETLTFTYAPAPEHGDRPAARAHELFETMVFGAVAYFNSTYRQTSLTGALDLMVGALRPLAGAHGADPVSFDAAFLRQWLTYYIPSAVADLPETAHAYLVSDDIVTTVPVSSPTGESATIQYQLVFTLDVDINPDAMFADTFTFDVEFDLAIYGVAVGAAGTFETETWLSSGERSFDLELTTSTYTLSFDSSGLYTTTAGSEGISGSFNLTEDAAHEFEYQDDGGFFGTITSGLYQWHGEETGSLSDTQVNATRDAAEYLEVEIEDSDFGTDTFETETSSRTSLTNSASTITSIRDLQLSDIVYTAAPGAFTISGGRFDLISSQEQTEFSRSTGSFRRETAPRTEQGTFTTTQTAQSSETMVSSGSISGVTSDLDVVTASHELGFSNSHTVTDEIGTFQVNSDTTSASGGFTSFKDVKDITIINGLVTTTDQTSYSKFSEAGTFEVDENGELRTGTSTATIITDDFSKSKSTVTPPEEGETATGGGWVERESLRSVELLYDELDGTIRREEDGAVTPASYDKHVWQLSVNGYTGRTDYSASASGQFATEAYLREEWNDSREEYNEAGPFDANDDGRIVSGNATVERLDVQSSYNGDDATVWTHYLVGGEFIREARGIRTEEADTDYDETVIRTGTFDEGDANVDGRRQGDFTHTTIIDNHSESIQTEDYWQHEEGAQKQEQTDGVADRSARNRKTETYIETNGTFDLTTADREAHSTFSSSSESVDEEETSAFGTFETGIEFPGGRMRNYKRTFKKSDSSYNESGQAIENANVGTEFEYQISGGFTSARTEHDLVEKIDDATTSSTGRRTSVNGTFFGTESSKDTLYYNEQLTGSQSFVTPIESFADSTVRSKHETGESSTNDTVNTTRRLVTVHVKRVTPGDTGNTKITATESGRVIGTYSRQESGNTHKKTENRNTQSGSPLNWPEFQFRREHITTEEDGQTRSYNESGSINESPTAKSVTTTHTADQEQESTLERTVVAKRTGTFTESKTTLDADSDKRVNAHHLDDVIQLAEGPLDILEDLEEIQDRYTRNETIYNATGSVTSTRTNTTEDQTNVNRSNQKILEVSEKSDVTRTSNVSQNKSVQTTGVKSELHQDRTTIFLGETMEMDRDDDRDRGKSTTYQENGTVTEVLNLFNSTRNEFDLANPSTPTASTITDRDHHAIDAVSLAFTRETRDFDKFNGYAEATWDWQTNYPGLSQTSHREHSVIFKFDIDNRQTDSGTVTRQTVEDDEKIVNVLTGETSAVVVIDSTETTENGSFTGTKRHDRNSQFDSQTAFDESRTQEGGSGQTHHESDFSQKSRQLREFTQNGSYHHETEASSETRNEQTTEVDRDERTVTEGTYNGRIEMTSRWNHNDRNSHSGSSLVAEYPTLPGSGGVASSSGSGRRWYGTDLRTVYTENGTVSLGGALTLGGFGIDHEFYSQDGSRYSGISTFEAENGGHSVFTESGGHFDWRRRKHVETGSLTSGPAGIGYNSHYTLTITHGRTSDYISSLQAVWYNETLYPDSFLEERNGEESNFNRSYSYVRDGSRSRDAQSGMKDESFTITMSGNQASHYYGFQKATAFGLPFWDLFYREDSTSAETYNATQTSIAEGTTGTYTLNTTFENLSHEAWEPPPSSSSYTDTRHNLLDNWEGYKEWIEAYRSDLVRYDLLYGWTAYFPTTTGQFLMQDFLGLSTLEELHESIASSPFPTAVIENQHRFDDIANDAISSLQEDADGANPLPSVAGSAPVTEPGVDDQTTLTIDATFDDSDLKKPEAVVGRELASFFRNALLASTPFGDTATFSDATIAGLLINNLATEVEYFADTEGNVTTYVVLAESITDSYGRLSRIYRIFRKDGGFFGSNEWAMFTKTYALPVVLSPQYVFNVHIRGAIRSQLVAGDALMSDDDPAKLGFSVGIVGEFDHFEFAKGLLAGFGEGIVNFLKGTVELGADIGSEYLKQVSKTWNPATAVLHTAASLAGQIIDSLLKVKDALLSQGLEAAAALALPEIHELFWKWDSISEYRRGQLIGILAGEWGAEFLTGKAAAKLLAKLKKVKVSSDKAMADLESRRNSDTVGGGVTNNIFGTNAIKVTKRGRTDVLFKQKTPYDCGPTGVLSVLRGLGKKVTHDELLKDVPKIVSTRGTFPDDLESMFTKRGVDAKAKGNVKLVDIDNAVHPQGPVLAMIDNGSGGLHWVVVEGFIQGKAGRHVQFIDPGNGTRWLVAYDDFAAKFHAKGAGNAVFINPRDVVAGLPD